MSTKSVPTDKQRTASKRLIWIAAAAISLAILVAYQSMEIRRFFQRESSRFYSAFPTAWATPLLERMGIRPDEDTSDTPEEDCVYYPPQPTLRSNWGLRGAIVRGWPSRGGLYVAEQCFGVELDFLGLDRFHESRRSDDQAEEDAFCKRMRMIGAKWFKNDMEYILWDPRDYGPDEDIELILGWPKQQYSDRGDGDVGGGGGGVWVLKLNRSDAIAKGTGRIHNAYNMEERCRAIEQMGGTYFSNPKDCPDTKDLV